MKECPNCHSQVEDGDGACPRCGHAFGPAGAALQAREQAELATAVRDLAREVVELKNALPPQQPINVIQNIIKGSFNDIGDKTYGDRGARVLKFPEIQAGTDRAWANKEAEKQAQGDFLRAEHLGELYPEADREWKEEVLRRLQDFGEQLAQSFDHASQLSRMVGEQLTTTEPSSPAPPSEPETPPQPKPPAPKPAPTQPESGAPRPGAGKRRRFSWAWVAVGVVLTVIIGGIAAGLYSQFGGEGTAAPTPTPLPVVAPATPAPTPTALPVAVPTLPAPTLPPLPVAGPTPPAPTPTQRPASTPTVVARATVIPTSAPTPTATPTSVPPTTLPPVGIPPTPPTATLTITPTGLRQWATSATASSQYSASSWSAMQTTGAPDITTCGDSEKAWAPRPGGTAPEWIELTFATPVHAIMLRVHETYNAGSIFQVDLRDTFGILHTVWTGPYKITCPGWFETAIPKTSFLTQGARIYTEISGWEEIDAVELIGEPERKTTGSSATPSQSPTPVPTPTPAPQPTPTRTPTPTSTPIPVPTPNPIPTPGLVSGAFIQGKIDFPGQVHWYTFEAQAGDAVFLVLAEGEGMAYMVVELFDSQAKRVGSADSIRGTKDATIDTKLESAGKYTVRVRHVDVRVGFYTLSFFLKSKGGGIPIASNSSIRGEIKVPGDVRWHTFEAQAGDAVFMVLVEGEGMDYMVVELFDSQAKRVGSADSYGGTKTATIDTKLESAGKYTIRVRHGGLKTGSYTLSFNKQP